MPQGHPYPGELILAWLVTDESCTHGALCSVQTALPDQSLSPWLLLLPRLPWGDGRGPVNPVGSR